MKTLFALVPLLALVACAAPTTSDSYCVQRHYTGRCIAWEMGPSRNQSAEFNRAGNSAPAARPAQPTQPTKPAAGGTRI